MQSVLCLLGTNAELPPCGKDESVIGGAPRLGFLRADMMYRFCLTDRRELRESLYIRVYMRVSMVSWVGLGCVAARVSKQYG